MAVTHERVLALADADTATLDAFWADVVRSGAPLVEPGDTPDERRVTFVWRSAAPAGRHVLLIGRFAGGPTDAPMERIAGTDVWAVTVTVPADLTSTYFFAETDVLVDPWGTPGLTDDERMELAGQLHRGIRPDPLNPLRLRPPMDPDHPDADRTGMSVVDLPGAAAQPFAEPRPDVPAGSLTELRLATDRLGPERRVWVRTPAVGADRAEATVVVFDGGAYAHFLPGPTVLDNLEADGLIPPTTVVFVHYADDARRNAELSMDDTFADGVMEDLLPFVASHVPLPGGRDRTFVGGCSLGGLTAVWLAQRHPDRFGGAFSQSGSFGFARPGGPPEELLQRFREDPPPPGRFYVDVGRFEVGAPDGGNDQLTVNRMLRDLLVDQGHTVTYREYGAGHDWWAWRATLPDALRALLGREGTR